MKKLTATLLAACALCLAGYSQTETNAPAPAPQNKDLGGALIGMVTNIFDPSLQHLTISLAGVYNYEAKKAGGALQIFRDIGKDDSPVQVGVGTGIYYFDGDFFSVTGQLELAAKFKPLAFAGQTNIVGRWFGYIGAGTPVSGAGPGNGGLMTVTATGLDVALSKATSKTKVSASVFWGYMSGADKYAGQMVGGAVNFGW